MSKAIDMAGQRFGRLTAIKAANKQKHGGIIWECICDCGRTVYVRQDNIKNGITKSCGCLKRELVRSPEWMDRLERCEGTSATRIRRTDHVNRNNTSGIRGVYWHKPTKRWSPQITFKGVHYSFGYFSNIEDAAKVRKEAEERIFGGFLEWYDEYIKPAKKIMVN